MTCSTGLADEASSPTRCPERKAREVVAGGGDRTVARLQAKSLEDPDEVRPTPFGRVDIYNLMIS